MDTTQAATVIQKKFREFKQNKTGNLTAEQKIFIKPWVKKWKAKSIFQVLLLYRADRLQVLVNFSFQIHLFNQKALILINKANIDVPVDEVDSTAKSSLYLPPVQMSAYKLPFVRESLIQKADVDSCEVLPDCNIENLKLEVTAEIVKQMLANQNQNILPKAQKEEETQTNFNGDVIFHFNEKTFSSEENLSSTDDENLKTIREENENEEKGRVKNLKKLLLKTLSTEEKEKQDSEIENPKKDEEECDNKEIEKFSTDKEQIIKTLSGEEKEKPETNSKNLKTNEKECHKKEVEKLGIVKKQIIKTLNDEEKYIYLGDEDQLKIIKEIKGKKDEKLKLDETPLNQSNEEKQDLEKEIKTKILSLRPPSIKSRQNFTSSIKELEEKFRGSDSETETPFNFRSMLRKTNYPIKTDQKEDDDSVFESVSKFEFKEKRNSATWDPSKKPWGPSNSIETELAPGILIRGKIAEF